MSETWVVLGDKLSDSLSAIIAQNEVIKHEPIPPGLIDDNFLNGLSFLNIHVNKFILSNSKICYLIITFKNAFIQ